MRGIHSKIANNGKSRYAYSHSDTERKQADSDLGIEQRNNKKAGVRTVLICWRSAFVGRLRTWFPLRGSEFGYSWIVILTGTVGRQEALNKSGL